MDEKDHTETPKSVRKIDEQHLKTLQQRQKLDSLQASSKKEAQDIERHRLKMQKKCRHEFDHKECCQYCGKKRKSHI